ncbi:MAG: YecA family protein [Candidatus Sigynarchaeota archaeon]
MAKPGRNDPCPCGSGKKYKKCCLMKDLAEKKQTTTFQPSQLSIKNPQRRQQIIDEYQPILETMERIVSARYQQDPSLTGQEIITVYKTLLGVLTRRVDEGHARASLANLAPRTRLIHDALEHAILTFDKSMHPHHEESVKDQGEGAAKSTVEKTRPVLSDKGVPIIKDCLSLLIDSAQFWTRERGSRGYLEYISTFFT